MPATHKAISMLFEIRKRDWSNSHASIKFIIGNTTAVQAGFVIEDWRSWAVATVTRRDGNFGHDETENVYQNRLKGLYIEVLYPSLSTQVHWPIRFDLTSHALLRTCVRAREMVKFDLSTCVGLDVTQHSH